MCVLKISTVRNLCILCTVCMLLLLVPASCVREDMEECMQYALNVRAVDNEGNDLTDSGVLQKADVYLFNENGFVKMVPSGISSDFLFGHDKRQKFTLVAWGNIKKDTMIVTDIKVGTSIEEARLQLRKHAEGSYIPITDIFYCRREMSNTTTRGMQEENITLVMERLAAGISIRTRYLAERYPYTGEPYTFIVRGTGTEVDFMGKIVRENAGYRPESTTDNQGDVYAPPFRIFPTEEGGHIEIDIYRNQERIYTIVEDNDFKPLYVTAGVQTNIDIDFRYAQVKTFVTIVPWGTINQDTEM
ncbi:FimB/Mfa2 family fimbrial subunit [Bacteroides sp.]|uniref:FimB/Mfa2 family fimbrial subunit n=1 Tax=Bacteroides sp. TaxID=29523 RepID=UPI0026390752|nr:FimB/Mfa2 family fimbrial subunit [Bacteroides sp.]